MAVTPTQTAPTTPVSSLGVNAAFPSSPAQVTPTQFAAGQTAKTQSTYQQYLAYLQTNMGRVDGTQIAQQAANDLSAEVNAELSPLAAQEQYGAQGITQYTKQLASGLNGISGKISSAYNTAEQQQSALDTAISAQLSGQGGKDVAALQASLAKAGQSTAPAAQAAQAVTGLAGAQYASGSASLSSLLASGAAANAYGASLPGIATLAGYQALGGLESNIDKQRTAVLTNAAKQYPSLVNNLTRTALSGQRNNLTALTDAGNLALRQASVDASVAKANQPHVFGSGSSGYFMYNPTTGETVQITKPAAKAPKTFGSASSGYFSIDPTTGKVTQLTNPVPKATKPASLKIVKTGAGVFEVDPTTGAIVGKLPGSASTSASAGGQTVDSFATSARELSDNVAKWGQGTSHLETQPDGTKKEVSNGDQIPYQTAITQAIQAGPNTKQWRQKAIATVNASAYYQPGDNGRPYQTIKQALPNIKQNVLASIQNGQPASAVYQAFLQTGVYPAKLRQALVYTINRLYTQDYFAKNPKANSLPANVLIAGSGQ